MTTRALLSLGVATALPGAGSGAELASSLRVALADDGMFRAAVNWWLSS